MVVLCSCFAVVLWKSTMFYDNILQVSRPQKCFLLHMDECKRTKHHSKLEANITSALSFSDQRKVNKSNTGYLLQKFLYY